MPEDWRILETLKILRQVVTCPLCGALVSTADGYAIHEKWHSDMNEYVSSVQQQLATFSDYIINPETGLQKRVQDRLDTITNYVISPETGLESRVKSAIDSVRQDATVAISNNSQAITQLRSDATAAITSLSARLEVLEKALP